MPVWLESSVLTARLRLLPALFGLLVAVLLLAPLAAEDFIPRRQDKPPGPALSPAEAIAKMTVPPGFQVELVAGEPDIVNPVAMTFDERGRIWVTESLEYPRFSAGPGQDRVKILEDTDGDGRADKFTVFAEGFNIPSGIAVGYGGVWLANSPDILFLQDTDGDGRADKQEVVVTGFGRADTHELPNSLTWGPDGWLYGLNGVFNPSHVTSQGKRFDFTCALFRINPRTREFQLVCEGTSNPWGVAWDNNGSAFVSACVIDHLWHLTETGYYIRQGGPYPPFATRIGSIVNFGHQAAAYCGIHYFDSDAYPAEFREKLYMGNIHGNRLNVDSLERDGSSYRGVDQPDFLVSNDVWFMPVVQKTGPDGCLYVLDWYDRYHCYQDARRDPPGVDRLYGRLYRIRYQNTPRAPKFDLTKESDDALIARLASPNVFYRDLAQRLLHERSHSDARPKLEQLALDRSAPRKARLHALWSLLGTGSLSPAFHLRLLDEEDATFRAWGVRAAGNFGSVDSAIRQRVVAMAMDASPDVRLQVAIAAGKISGVQPIPVLLDVLSASDGDKLIPQIVWQNLHPLMEEQSSDLLDRLTDDSLRERRPIQALLPRLVERLLGSKSADPAAAARLFALVAGGARPSHAAAQSCLALLASKIQSREITGERLARFKPLIAATLASILQGPADGPLYLDAALLSASWEDPAAIEIVRKVFVSPQQPVARRLQALDALVAARDNSLPSTVSNILADKQAGPVELRAGTLGALGRAAEPWVAQVVLANYDRLEPELQPKAVELLTQRSDWAMSLLDAIGQKQLPAAALNANQVQRLLASRDTKLVDKVRAQWGSVRSERNPAREKVIAEMRALLNGQQGNPHAGQAVFRKLCGQCHKIYGEGQEVGPDITVNGRASFEQLLSNVFDPSLVIGAAYQARMVITTDGRVLTGLVAEDNDERIVLKQEGGKLETIARADVEAVKTSQLSLMPEELEKQLTPQELLDLFAFILLDKPPGDPAARRIPGK